MNNKNLVKIVEKDVKPIVAKLKTKPLHNSLVIVTGASGLIGTYLLAILSRVRKQKHVKFRLIAVVQSPPTKLLKAFVNTHDRIIQGNLANSNFVKSLPKADLIVHGAGYGQPGKFLEKPLETILLNTVTTSQLIQKLNKKGRFLFISSSEVYSGLANPPFREDQIGITNPQHPRSCYIEGKRCGEAICSALSSTNNHVVVARLSLAYGPGTKRGDQRVLNTFIEKAITKREVALLDSGQAKRTYCYVADAAEMLLNIALFGTKPVYNVGGKSHVSIKKLAKMVGHYTDARVSFPKLAKELPGSPDNVYISMKRYEKEFGKKKGISLEKGLKRTIMWQKELYK